MKQHFPLAQDSIRWYHKLAAAPLQLLAAANLGPLGGDNSISAVIEAVLLKKRGESVTFPLSKTDSFFVAQLTQQDIPDEMIEYRELSHEVQREILRRRSGGHMVVIWLGAGVFTLEHPLLAEKRPFDWHIWTDASPKVVSSARELFDEMLQKGQSGNISNHVTLPEQVTRLNHLIELTTFEADQLVFMGYGVTYALTMAENQQWLQQLILPPGRKVSFVFNAPAATIPMLPGVMAAFHHQRMVHYERSHIEALCTIIPNSKIVWEKPRETTRNKIWGTWLIEAERR